SAARARRDRSGRAFASLVQGVAIWVSGTLVVAFAAAFIAVLAVEGWQGLKAASSSPVGFDLTRSLIGSGYILGIALPLVIIPAFLAAAAGYDVELGGPTTRWLTTSLRVGPMTPAIAIGAAALWFGVRGGECDDERAAHPDRYALDERCECASAPVAPGARGAHAHWGPPTSRPTARTHAAATQSSTSAAI
ncbi:MAG: hypothetical protein ACHQY2_01675, partial [Candidatus Eremiobacterales bacterium]